MRAEVSILSVDPLVAFGLSIAGIVLLTTWRRRVMQRSRAIADRLGLAFSPGVLGYRMSGSVRGLDIEVFTTPGDSYGGSRVVFRADLGDVLPPGFIFQRDDGTRGVARHLTGIPDLDESHLLHAPDRERALALVRHPLVAKALTGLVAVVPNLFIRYGRLEARLPRTAANDVEPTIDELLRAAIAIREAALSSALPESRGGR